MMDESLTIQQSITVVLESLLIFFDHIYFYFFNIFPLVFVFVNFFVVIQS